MTGAYELFSQCNDLGRSGFNLTANDRNLFLISQIYHRSGNLDRAEDYVRKSMEISKIRAVGSKRSATFATRCEEAADICFDKSDYDSAIAYALEGLE